MADLQLTDPVHRAPGVTRAKAALLAEPPFKVRTVGDLVWYLPRQGAYKDVGAIQQVAEVRVGEPATVVGTIIRWDRINPRRPGRGGKRLTIQKATVRDDDNRKIVADDDVASTMV